jgi:hypothetical protein
LVSMTISGAPERSSTARSWVSNMGWAGRDAAD